MADTAQVRLERLLYVLPAAARNGGVSLAELANALGVSTKAILKDIEEAVTRIDHHPPSSTDIFTILIEHDRIEVQGKHFHRPTRLTAHEALALAVGLRALAAEAGASERDRIVALAARLEHDLQVPRYPQHPLSASDVAMVDPAYYSASLQSFAESVDEIEVEFDEDEVRGRIARAIEEGLACGMLYIKSGAREPERRTVRPQSFVYSEGNWYVAAHDYDREEGRLFRIDRIVSVEFEGARELPFDEVRLPTGPYAFVADDAMEQVRVRYSPRVARWVAERTGQQLDPGGDLTLTHEVADPRWIVRHVLLYGADAEVLEPAWVRRLVQDTAEKLAG